jgi:hypothetical protein
MIAQESKAEKETCHTKSACLGKEAVKDITTNNPLYNYERRTMNSE